MTLTKSKNTKNKRKAQRSSSLALTKGKGDYSTMVRKFKNTVMDVTRELKPIMNPLIKAGLTQGGGAVGGMAGSYVGLPPGVGSMVGSALGARLSKLIGSGDYTSNSPSCNSLFKGKGNSALSSFDDTRGVRIRHREFLSDLTVSATGFQIKAYQINPGLPNSFPFLANMANSFEEYRVNGLVYEFISTATPYSTTPGMGSVIMSAEYNTANGDYTSKVQMENSEYAISSPPYKSMAYGVECEKNWSNNLFVRASSGSLPGPLTDLGTFFIATNNVALGTIGEVWVTYDVTFLRPRQSTMRYGVLHSSATTTGTSIAVSNTDRSFKVRSGVFNTAVWTSATTLAFPDAMIGDVYRIEAYVYAGGNVVNPVSISSSSGLTNFTILNGNSASFVNSPGGSLQNICTYFFIVANVNPYVTFSPATVATSVTSTVDIMVTDLGGNLNITEV